MTNKSLDLGLLLLRLGVAIPMAAAHGWGKFQMLLSDEPAQFPDPLGVGSTTSLALAVFGELVCPILIAFGALTRLSAIPLAITMAVAVFVIHADDPFQKQELGLLYLIPCVVLVLTGGGSFSIDAVLSRKSDSDS